MPATIHSCALVDSTRGFETAASGFFGHPERAGFDQLVIDGSRTRSLYGDLLRHGPERVAGWFVERGDAARRDGYDGLQVVADVTPLLHDAEARDAYRAYELVIDRRMRLVGHLSGLCVVDRSRVDADTALDICRVHEDSDPPSDFRMYARADGYHLDGDVDASNVDGLVRILDVAGLAPLCIDLTGCGYLDHRALLAIERAAALRGGRARLVNAPPIVVRVVTLLGLSLVEASP